MRLTVIIILGFLSVTNQTLAQDCNFARQKLSYQNYESIYNLEIKEKKYDQAILQYFDLISHLPCMSEYTPITTYTINKAVFNIGTIYANHKNYDENKAIKLYEKHIGSIVKDKALELFLFNTFVTGYTYNSFVSWHGRKTTGKICKFTTDWGTIYFGCKKVEKVSNSPLALLPSKKLNDISMAKTLSNIAFVNQFLGEKICPENGKSTDFEAYDYIIPMVIKEKYIMNILSKNPKMAKTLLEKASKLDYKFNEDDFLSVCQE